jgi:hypothetical protein
MYIPHQQDAVIANAGFLQEISLIDLKNERAPRVQAVNRRCDFLTVGNCFIICMLPLI